MEGTTGLMLLLMYSMMQMVHSFTELPKFSQLLLLYPGYPHSGGDYRDRDLLQHIADMDSLDDPALIRPHNTASLRMSWTLNRYSGRHALGTEPIYLSHEGRDSITGRDSQQYIFRNTAFGPYLAAKYGNPSAIMLDPLQHEANVTVKHFQDKQGIIRFLSYHRDHAGGHIALWDCDHFHQSKDWSTEHHIISVEFWESPDSYCPPKSTGPTPSPQMVTLKPGTNIKVIARHNFESLKDHHKTKSVVPRVPVEHNTDILGKDETRTQKLRHKMDRRRQRGRRLKTKGTLWVQEGK